MVHCWLWWSGLVSAYLSWVRSKGYWVRETNEATAYSLLRNHHEYVKRRNLLILKAWRDEGVFWADIAERTGLSITQCKRAATLANGGTYPEARFYERPRGN